jgi:hypothetical protein
MPAMPQETSITTAPGGLYPAAVIEALSGRTLLGLDWGVKTSFRRYVSRMVDGVCEVGRGAAPAGGGAFRFPAAASSPVLWDGGIPIEFSGILRFVAHGGILSLTIVDPRIERGEAGGPLVLSIADGAGSGAQRIPFAQLVPRAADDPSTGLSFEAVLTAEGASLFMGNYTAGEDLDDVTVRHAPGQAAGTGDTVRPTAADLH